MKTILLIAALFFSAVASAQFIKQSGGGAPGVIIVHRGASGADSGTVVTSFADTSIANRGPNIKKTNGLIINVNGTVYIRKTSISTWVPLSAVSSTYYGIDSITYANNLLCQWKNGISICYTVVSAGNSVGGVDSVTLSGSTLCQWKSGISTCYTITGGTVLGTGIDSVTVAGTQLCQWKTGVPTCYTISNVTNNTYYVDSSITSVTNYIDSSIAVNNYYNGIDSNTLKLTGSVTVVQNFDFASTIITYKILGRFFSTPATFFPNAVSSDPTKWTTIVFYGDTLGNIGYRTTVPSPIFGEIPFIDPASECIFAIYYIPPQATTLLGVSSTVVYAEHIGGEFDITGTATGLDPDFTSNVFAGTKALRVGTFTNGQTVIATNISLPALLDLNLQTFIKGYVRLGTAFSKTTKMNFTLTNAGTPITSTVTMNSGTFGWDRSIVGTYQFITIPMSAFTSLGGNSFFDGIRISFTGTNSGGVQFDNISLQSGGSNVTTTGVLSIDGQTGNVRTKYIDTIYRINDSSFLSVNRYTGYSFPTTIPGSRDTVDVIGPLLGAIRRGATGHDTIYHRQNAFDSLARLALSVTGSGGTYDNTTGVFNLTGGAGGTTTLQQAITANDTLSLDNQVNIADGKQFVISAKDNTIGDSTYLKHSKTQLIFQHDGIGGSYSGLGIFKPIESASLYTSGKNYGNYGYNSELGLDSVSGALYSEYGLIRDGFKYNPTTKDTSQWGANTMVDKEWSLANMANAGVKFGIQDNIGLQNRLMDMGAYNLDITSGDATFAGIATEFYQTPNYLTLFSQDAGSKSGLIELSYNQIRLQSVDGAGKGITLNLPHDSISIRYTNASAPYDFTRNIVTSITDGSGQHFANDTGNITISSGGGTTETASNGLNKVVNDIQLGGALTSAVTISSSVAANNISIYGPSGFGSPSILDVSSTAASFGSALTVSSNGTAVYVYGNGSSGNGLNVITSGTGIAVYSIGLAGSFTSNPVSTTGYISPITLSRTTNGTATNGIGISLPMIIENESGSSVEANTVFSKLTDASASPTSEMSFAGLNSGTTNTLLTLSGNGATKLNKYGVGTFTGTPTYSLLVDASGNVIEGSVSGGSSVVKETHTAGATITLANTTTWLVVNPATLLAALTVTLPATPTDGQLIDISFGGTITASGSGVVTSFTVAANAGQGLIGSGTYGLVETEDHVSYRYNLSLTKWYRN